MFIFKDPNSSNLDSRAVFANVVFKELYIKNNCDALLAIEDCRKLNLFRHFEKHIRNIYELVSIDSQIPLMALEEILSGDADQYNMTSFEFEQALNRTRIACKEYYGECEGSEVTLSVSELAVLMENNSDLYYNGILSMLEKAHLIPFYETNIKEIYVGFGEDYGWSYELCKVLDDTLTNENIALINLTE